MSPLPSCLILTEDETVKRSVEALLSPITSYHTVDSCDRFERALLTGTYGLLLIDIRTEKAFNHLSHWMASSTSRLIIVMGESRSEPILEALKMGAYESIPLSPDRISFQHLMKRALEHASLLDQNEQLQSTHQQIAPPPAGILESPKLTGQSPLSFFSNAFRGYQDLNTLLTHIVEGILRSMRVSRSGIFTWNPDQEKFQLEAGLKCLEETERLEFSRQDPLIQWMEIHAHMITPSTLDHVRDPAEKTLLHQALQTFGAEIILPLHTQGRMSGWVFMGHRISGVPFDLSDLENLIIVAEHISTTIENSQLYEEVALQTALARTLFHTLPTAIIATGPDLTIRWFNSSAERILGRTEKELVGQSVEKVSHYMASLFRQCLADQDPGQAHVWQDPESKRVLSAEMKILKENNHLRGAVALIQDRTKEKRMQEQQDQIDRAQFWNELAASMSHEIRNPLVAIKTFSQLLPERHEDPSFRQDFSTVVTDEVDRLNQIVDQISNFANPPAVNFALMDVPQMVNKAIEQAKFRAQSDSTVAILQAIDKSIPMILADKTALTECLTHLLTNAIEACDETDDPVITISGRMTRMAQYSSVSPDSDRVDFGRTGGEDRSPSPPPSGAEPSEVSGKVGPGILLCVEDNGRGIPEHQREEVYSPFFTTKAKGMGLGLAIARRTIIDHGGEMDLCALKAGTRVSITLPQHAGVTAS